MATNENGRDDCIDAYFQALDEEDPELARGALSEDFVYESLSGTLEGFDGFVDYINEHRSLSDSTHAIDRRIHGDGVSVVEGVVSGVGSDGSQIEADYCDVIDFDDDGESIRSIAVYLNDS